MKTLKKIYCENKLKGGLGDEFSEKNFDSKELKMGIDIEKEHTNDSNIAREIAMDHLAEIPDYYSRLKKMEKTVKKEGMNETVSYEQAKKKAFDLTNNLIQSGMLVKWIENMVYRKLAGSTYAQNDDEDSGYIDGIIGALEKNGDLRQIIKSKFPKREKV